LRDTAARDVFLCALTRIGSKGKNVNRKHVQE
jgi:hypothetical protein